MDVTASTILLAEDDPNDVLLMRRAFDKTKIANPLQVVGDGEAAISYLRGTGAYADRSLHPLPCLLLLDLKMPRRSGLEVLEWLRTQPSIRNLRVVVLTSSAEAPDIRQAYELGASSYLVKPVAFEDLVEMVKTLGLYWLILNEMPAIAAH